MGRFLTEVAGFANTPALLGSVELIEGEKQSAIAIVHAFVQNQGDAWTVISAYLDRFVDEQRLLSGSAHPGESEEQVPYLRYMSQTGRRVAEMHLALAGSSEPVEFAPEAIASKDVQRWIEDVVGRSERVFEVFEQRRVQTARAGHLAHEAEHRLAADPVALEPTQCRVQLRGERPGPVRGAVAEPGGRRACHAPAAG